LLRIRFPITIKCSESLFARKPIILKTRDKNSVNTVTVEMVITGRESEGNQKGIQMLAEKTKEIKQKHLHEH